MTQTTKKTKQTTKKQTSGSTTKKTRGSTTKRASASRRRKATTEPQPAPRAHIEGVLIVGGGYAGVHAARAAHDHGVAVTVVDPTGDYDFVPRLAAVAGGTAPADDATAPLAKLVDRVRLGTVTKVGDGEVELLDGMRLSADAVVLTAGAVPIRPPIDGLDKAWPLRTSDDALALRHAVTAIAGSGDERDLPRSVPDTTSVVVVGGGATGVQLAGAVKSSHRTLDVHLVDTGDLLLAGMDGLGRDAERILTDRGVDVRLGTVVEAIDDTGVVLDRGDRIDGLVVWAAGFEARADELGVEVHDNGRVLVDDDLRVLGSERTFAAGDIAFHLDAERQALPMSAQIAVQAGAHAGKNAARLVRDEQLAPARLSQQGWVLDLGSRRRTRRTRRRAPSPCRSASCTRRP
jgi:NADH dehydrogenase